jgi:hypothetical protein
MSGKTLRKFKVFAEFCFSHRFHYFEKSVQSFDYQQFTQIAILKSAKNLRLCTPSVFLSRIN